MAIEVVGLRNMATQNIVALNGWDTEAGVNVSADINPHDEIMIEVSFTQLRVLQSMINQMVEALDASSS